MASVATSCDVFGCGNVKPCAQHTRERKRLDVKPEHHALYDTQLWRRLSRSHLRRYRLCGDRPPVAPMTSDSLCVREGRIEAATQADHIIPHRGDRKLFWAESNRQSLCNRCHGVKSRGEMRDSRGKIDGVRQC